MPIILMISRHTPENCPMFNEKARKVSINLFSKLDGLLKKYGGKLLWGGGVTSEHLSILIFEAPSLESFEKASMEPELLAFGEFETCEVKLATSIEESMKFLKGK